MARRSREGTVYQRKDGYWVAEISLPSTGGKRGRRVKYAKTEREALVNLRQMLREKDAGLATSDMTLKDWLPYWLRRIAPDTASERTIKNYRSHARLWLTPTMGRMRLSQIRPEDVRDLRFHLETSPRYRNGTDEPWFDDDGQPVLLSSASVRSIMVTLSAALEAAVAERRIVWNPASVVGKPAAASKKTPHLSSAQARALIDGAANAQEQARHALALYAGLRQGEALALTRADIDLEAGLVSVTKTAARVTGYGMVVTPGAKTARSVRVVPLHPVARETLRAWLEDAPSPYIFGGKRPTSDRIDHRRWKDACLRVGVPVVPLQGARTTTGVLLREAGIPPHTIAAILGHKPGSIVNEQHYAFAQLPELEHAIMQINTGAPVVAETEPAADTPG